MTNWGERMACATDMVGCASSWVAAPPTCLANAGADLTKRETGTMMAATIAAMIRSEVRQSWIETSHAASGDMTIGAMPIPAETSETARLRRVSNQPVTQAIIGAKIAAVAPPTASPKISWKARRDV